MWQCHISSDHISIEALHCHQTINCRKTKTLAVLPSSICPQPQTCSAHLWTQSPRFSTWVAQCPKTVVTVLRCHPGLSKPRRHLALSTEGCGCRRGSRLPLSSVSSLLSPCQLSYELECTSLLEPEAHCLQCFVMCCFRITLPISIWDNKHNISIWKAAKQQRVSSLLSQCSYTLQDI